MDYKKLGRKIREARLKLNLTQAQLAEAIDISDTYMGAIERGERSLTLDTLVRLVNRLGVTVDYLLLKQKTSSRSFEIYFSGTEPPHKINIFNETFYSRIDKQLNRYRIFN